MRHSRAAIGRSPASAPSSCARPGPKSRPSRLVRSRLTSRRPDGARGSLGSGADALPPADPGLLPPGVQPPPTHRPTPPTCVRPRPLRRPTPPACVQPLPTRRQARRALRSPAAGWKSHRPRDRSHRRCAPLRCRRVRQPVWESVPRRPRSSNRTQQAAPQIPVGRVRCRLPPPRPPRAGRFRPDSRRPRGPYISAPWFRASRPRLTGAGFVMVARSGVWRLPPSGPAQRRCRYSGRCGFQSRPCQCPDRPGSGQLADGCR